MPNPPMNWMEALPKGRCLAEFSLWSANLIAMGDDLDRVGGLADIYHIDVADGVFAPSFLLFPDLVAALRKRTAIPFHVHLMADDRVLMAQVAQFAEAGADLISVHAENGNAGQALADIRARGLKAGIVLKVDTPVAEAGAFADRIDMLTLLGTRIGVKGQGLDPAAVARLDEARKMLGDRRCLLAADGGIREETVPLLYAGGADTVVMGSLAYGAADLRARMAWLHGLKRA